MPAKGATEAPIEAPPLDGPGGIRVEAVTRTFVSKRGRVTALEGLSLDVSPREIVAVVGPSGCGKTTLLELICGLQTPDAGTVLADPALLMPQGDATLP